MITSAKKRPKILNEVEKLPFQWVSEKQLSGDSISDTAVCEKAVVRHEALHHQTPYLSLEEECAFKASQGWCYKFKNWPTQHRQHCSDMLDAKTAKETELYNLMVAEIVQPARR